MEDKIVIAYVCDNGYIPYLKKSIDSYDRESIKITDFREEKFHKVILVQSLLVIL